MSYGTLEAYVKASLELGWVYRPQVDFFHRVPLTKNKLRKAKI